MTRGLSNRSSSILSSLDIPISKELPGVYDGRWGGTGDILDSVCPTTGEILARVKSVRRSVYAAGGLLILPQATPQELHGTIEKTREAFHYFRNIPAPKRGEILRQIRQALADKVRCGRGKMS
jgi:aldehyde dehydrogenase family 7 protein A1